MMMINNTNNIVQMMQDFEKGTALSIREFTVKHVRYDGMHINLFNSKYISSMKIIQNSKGT